MSFRMILMAVGVVMTASSSAKFLIAQNQLVPVSSRIKQEPQDEKISVGPGADNQFESIKALATASAKYMGFSLAYTESDFGDDKSPLRFSDKMEMTKEELFQLTQTILRSKGLAIVLTDNRALRQVVRVEEVRQHAPEGKPENFQGPEYLTQVIQLKNISTANAVELINKYLNRGTGGNPRQPPISEISNRRLLVISETSTNLKKIAKLLSRYDISSESIVTRFRKVEGTEAEELVNYLEKILNLKKTAEQKTGQITGFAENVSISTDPLSNRIVLIGPALGVKQVEDLIEELEGVRTAPTVESYRFQFITAEKMDELIRRSLGNLNEEQLAFVYKSVIDKQSNQLVVTARPDIHERILNLKNKLDVKPDKDNYTSPVQYYKIRYVKAADILRTIQAVEQGVNRDRRNRSGRQPLNGTNSNRQTSRVNDNAQGNSQQNPASRQTQQVADNSVYDPSSNRMGQDGERRSEYPFDIQQAQSAIAYQLDLAANLRTKSVLPGKAEVVVDENSNQLMVIAEPAVQRLYEEMIAKLDRPRPQVLVEVTVVTIDRNDDQNLGIEISSGDRTGSKRLFAFTQYGLSSVDPTNGALSILPGLGFNGTLIDADVADVVLRSLASHTRTRVVAAPRILVNDNATGVLSSVAEVPYAQVNASNTVATTSLGGFAEAGTTISVTPQIGEGENLNLEFDVIISDFTDSASADLPPPRRSDQVKSSVTIPDGHTVIVGGLKRKRDARSRQGIPFVENVPVFRLLSSNLGVENDFQNIYVFIKPIILRDDKYRDLQFLSTLERRDASVSDDLPKSCPLLIKTPTP